MTEIPRKSAEASLSVPWDIEMRLKGFDEECGRQIRNPLAGDERVSSFAIAAQHSVANNSQFRTELNGIFHARPNEPIPYTFSRMVRSFQKPLISQEGQEIFDYPKRFNMPNWSNWSVAFDWVLNHPKFSDEFSYDMWTRDLGSNIIARGKNLKLLTLLLPGVIPPDASIIDIGCSGNRVLKTLLLNRLLARTRVFREVKMQGSHAETEKSEHKIDVNGTSIVNSALASHVSYGRSIGVDKEFLYDTSIKEWEEACTFLPSERLNQDLRDEYDFLDKQNVSDVGFIQADFSQEIGSIFKNEGVERHAFNLVFYSTVLYMLKEELRKVMLDNGNVVKHHKGTRVVADNSFKDPNTISGLGFNPDFTAEWQYTTHIDDPSGSGEWLEVFKWRNGRCLDLKAGNDLGRLAMLPGVNTTLLKAIAGSA